MRLRSMVTVRLPGAMVRRVSRATLLVTVTVTVTDPPAPRFPSAGVTVILPAIPGGILIT